MPAVRPKKQLGQHFLNDENIALKIVESLEGDQADSILEIGPGMGVLTKHLLPKYGSKFYAAEIDNESVTYLNSQYPALTPNLISGDFLRMRLDTQFTGKLAIIGNFPYNISSQIFFKVLENKEMIPEVVGMIQKEVAQRLAEKPGTKTYGILSVLLQAYYDITYLFTVNENVFTPPPKVKSAVIRLTRNSTQKLACDEKLFVRVVKAAFNQRRKTLRNSLKSGFGVINIQSTMLDLRPERLSVEQFVELTNSVEAALNNQQA
ncbi:MAG TPA: 16S rRNA (adenine(1518)-N(6)/adenine(1519)-N(6))-dimethyltransferase RsmA [Tenuifilaceae bacterium]|nr:16S rRNA (adenine(1518)-N(6)/adenine(1519)-N(6))-dimethyltransferase RsmA [Tenuifilaceae bacterium]HQB78277.1 16S rRNA (adenine(1518)-N(6)/adenine(1519)-N(6))-dimethyltransferase RsmA [Tenuifilaceae bacterium]